MDQPGPSIMLTVSPFIFSSSCYNCIFFYLIEISALDPVECKLPRIREICILVYVYENEVHVKFAKYI